MKMPIIIPPIKLISTRELLDARHRPIQYEEHWTKEMGEPKHRFPRLGKGGVGECVEVTTEEIYAELALREHVPNKHEGAILRRMQSETGLSKDQVMVKYPRIFEKKEDK